MDAASHVTSFIGMSYFLVYQCGIDPAKIFYEIATWCRS